jgi:hypothetical protein
MGLGVKSTRPVNVNGVYNINGNINYSFPVKALKATLEVGSTAGFSRNKQFINGTQNDIRIFSAGPDLRIDMTPVETLNIGLEYGINYVKTKYSLQSSLNADYLSQDYSVSLDWEMPKRFFFSTEFNYTIYSQRAQGFNLRTPLWNASISKQFLKYNRGELKLSARDLLNRNIGVSRNTNNNYIEDSRVLTLKQFFLLSFTYSLTKTGASNEGRGGTRMIIR